MMAECASIAAGICKFAKSGTENYLSRRLEKMKNRLRPAESPVIPSGRARKDS